MAGVLVPWLAGHPWLSALGVCLLVNPFFLGAVENIPGNALWLEEFLVLGGGALWLYRLRRRGRITKRKAAAFGVLYCLADFLLLALYTRSRVKTVWVFAGWCLLLWLFREFAGKHCWRRQVDALCIMGAGFFLKLSYILGTSVYTRQHDIGLFSPGAEGHAGYIEYLLQYHALPDFDVRTMWQFCHPPLHHILSALWIDINENILSVGHNPARESLQTLTLFYSMCIVIAAYRVLRYFRLEGAALYIPLAMVSFHPTFVILAGSVNNDVLSIALSAAAAACTLRWYADPTMKNILKTALCVGLGMMAKLSAGTIAPAVGLVFLAVYYRRREERAALARQFVCFGAVSVPLGVWYEVRNLLCWGVPLTYVQELSTNSQQYLGGVSLAERFMDFSSLRLGTPYVGFVERGDAANEQNPLVSLLKCAVFGEWNYGDVFDSLPLPGCLFILGFILALTALAALAVVCAGRGGGFQKGSGDDDRGGVWFLGVYHVVMLAAYFRMQAAYPFVCTMDFRYIAPTVVTGAVFLGVLVSRWTRRGDCWPRAVTRLLAGITAAFATCSAAGYLMISIS